MSPIRHATKVSRVSLLTLAVLAIGAVGPATAQDRDDRQFGEEQGHSLVGVWESVAQGAVDCETREPFGPIIRSVYTIHQGGTMSEENTDPIDGPYRTSGFGIWKRTSGRTYTAVYGHYGFTDPASDPPFEPTKELKAIVRARTQIRLSRDAKSFTENGTFEVFFPDPETSEPGDPVFSGCFSARAYRLTF